MFGYVVVNKPELKCREFDEYRGYYCGLCKSLGKNTGFFSKFAVNYDLTFLSLLYADLYEPEIKVKTSRCMLHPIKGNRICIHEYDRYCSEMTVYLTWLKCMDDWKDDRKLMKCIYALILRRQAKKVINKYPEKCRLINEYMNDLSEKESSGCSDLELVSEDFGRILSEIFVMKKDEWENELRKAGFFLGKYIYILDAYDDLKGDIKKESYNPLKAKFKNKDFDDYVKDVLMTNIAECCKNFEVLPLVEYASILKNILYSGVWTKYYEIVMKK